MNSREMSFRGSNNYIPVASNEQPGIASFYNEHFDVIDGKVYIKRRYFQSLLEEYYKNELRNIHFSKELVGNTLIENMYTSDGELVNTTEVTLPFSKYVSDISLQKNVDTITMASYSGDIMLKTQSINLKDYATQLRLTSTGQHISLDLLNRDTVLSSADIDMSIYANNFSAERTGNDLVFKLLNEGKILQSSTINLNDYAKNINISQSGNTVTFKLLNGSNVISSSTFNTSDSFKDCKLDFALDTNTYVMTASLKDKNGNTITSASVDFPIESVVVGAEEYDGTVVLTLQNGNTTSFYIGDLVDGLVSQYDYNDDIDFFTSELARVSYALKGYTEDLYALTGEGF